MEKIIILAGDKKQASNWIYDNILNSENVDQIKMFVYADTWMKIREHKVAGMVIVGTFWDRPDARKLFDEVVRSL